MITQVTRIEMLTQDLGLCIKARDMECTMQAAVVMNNWVAGYIEGRGALCHDSEFLAWDAVRGRALRIHTDARGGQWKKAAGRYRTLLLCVAKAQGRSLLASRRP